MDLSLARRSTLFLTELDASPSPWAVQQMCNSAGAGSVLLDYPTWLDYPMPPPYSVPRATWPGGTPQAARFIRELQHLGIAVGLQMPLHEPLGGWSNIETHVRSIADLVVALGANRYFYFDGAEHSPFPLHTTVREVCEMFLGHLPPTTTPRLIQASVPYSIYSGVTRVGQTDIYWEFEDLFREITLAAQRADEQARACGVAAEIGWIPNSVPGANDHSLPWTPMELDHLYATALGHNASVTLRTTMADLREANYPQSTTVPLIALDYLRLRDGGSGKYNYITGPMAPEQRGWMYCPPNIGGPWVLPAFEVPYPARAHPHIHMLAGETEDAWVVLVWNSGEAPLVLEYDLDQANTPTTLRKVVDYRGAEVGVNPCAPGKDSVTIPGKERVWLVVDNPLPVGDPRRLSRYELNIAMRFATASEQL